ncbi:plasmid replication protein RepC [Pseudorhizobium flavum]|uniref:plasmid replication protein RepC n=1 Tax=Pseudorhizobium flavum TaxID=1335061 RepID=UPI00376FEA37
METHNIATTPFGGRAMSLALLAGYKKADKIPEGKSVNKWEVYRNLCEGKASFGVTDRSLAILHALLSFYPDAELSEEHGLVVFPSNRQLSLRAHGMADTSLRRHLAALVDAGLILRRDSPNGKRYARKTDQGVIEDAFGFSLAPLLVRAEEFQAAADHVRAESRALKLMRERVTLYRRDIYKIMEAAMEEGAAGDWRVLWSRFRAVVEAIPRRATVDQLEAIVGDLSEIREDIDRMLEKLTNTENMDGNDVQYGRQHSESKPESHYCEFEPALEKAGEARAEPISQRTSVPKAYPLGLVLKACPEIIDYAPDGISSWRDFMMIVAQVRGFLGISPSAYADALDVMGQETTAIVIACILQRSNHINSAGGYLRALTDKAKRGDFSVGPMLMAALKMNGEPARMVG